MAHIHLDRVVLSVAACVRFLATLARHVQTLLVIKYLADLDTDHEKWTVGRFAHTIPQRGARQWTGGTLVPPVPVSKSGHVMQCGAGGTGKTVATCLENTT